MPSCSLARVVGLAAQALLGLALALTDLAARATEQPPGAVAGSISQTIGVEADTVYVGYTRRRATMGRPR